MRKRIIATALVTMMVLSAAGCGKTSESADSAKSSSTTTSDSASNDSDKKTEVEKAAEDSTDKEEKEETAQSDVQSDTQSDTQADSEADTQADSEAEPAEASDPESTETAMADEPGDVDDSDFYYVATNLDKQTVEDYAALVKETYLQANWVGISEMIYYPITMYPDVVVNNSDEFLSYMEGKAIAGEDRAAIEDESCVNMFANSGGICLGSGQIWLGENPDTGSLGIISLSGIVER